jgi:FkbM family methyltransferase
MSLRQNHPRRFIKMSALKMLKASGLYPWIKMLHTYRSAARWTDDDVHRLSFYSQFINSEDTVYDVGANIGNRTKIFRRLAKRVIAIEPQEHCVAVLRRQFSKDSRVNIISKAAGSNLGVAQMFVGNADTLSSLSREWIDAVQQSGRFSHYAWRSQRQVELTTLDQLIAEYGFPSYIKIDVEGYEYEVLRGLSRAVRALSFEFTPEYLDSAFKCVEHLCLLGIFQFNYSVGESMELALPSWVSATQIKAELWKYRDDPSLFGDLYAKCQNQAV